MRYATHANGVDGRAPGAARVLAATDGGDRHIGTSLCDAAARWLECGKGGLSVGFLFGADTLQGFPPSAVVIALGLRLLALHSGKRHLRLESRAVVPAWWSRHCVSCSRHHAAFGQKIHLCQLSRFSEPVL